MKTVIRSTTALTTAHGLGYLISLAEVPVLARSLGQTAYGELVWVQATALLASILVDYGFNLSASRGIATRKDNSNFLRQLCGDVFIAKLLLLVIITLPLLITYLIFTPVSVGMFIAGFLYFLGFGFTPFWYFQGIEKMGRAVAVETLTRAISLLALLLFVKSPEDKTLGLTIMAVGSVTSTTATIVMCRVAVGQFNGSIKGAIKQLKNSTPFFVYKSSGQLMSSAATTMLGSIAGNATVGIFSPAEKVVKAVCGLALPVFHAFYPHLSSLFIANRQQKNQQSILLVVFVTGAGLMAAISLTFIGPTIMHSLLGPGFDAVDDLMVVMVWLIPLRLLNQTLGFAVLLPAGIEHQAGNAALLSSVLSLGFGTYLAMQFGAIGMVIGMLIGEIVLVTVQLWLCNKS